MTRPTAEKTALALVLAALLWATLGVVGRHGFLGVLLLIAAHPAAQLLAADLILCIALVSLWMLVDARRRGGSALPYVLLAWLYGAAGPLLYLLTRGLSRRRQRLAGLALACLGVLGLGLGTGWADLRTRESADATATGRERGRGLLRGAAERHGLAAWSEHRTQETVARDVWTGQGWWPERDQRLTAQALLGTFTSRVRLLDGRGSGQIWGLQAWAPYRREAGSEKPVFLSGPVPEIEFYLPTLQYFNELPFRLLNAAIALDAGDARLAGRRYHRVFVTWGRPEPGADVDQYLLWIDAETMLVEMVRYTVRDAVAFAQPPMRGLMPSLALGTMHYDDYREVQGVMVPFEQTVTLPPPELTRHPVARHFFHRLEVDSVCFDCFDPAELLPDPDRPEPADRKPAARSS